MVVGPQIYGGGEEVDLSEGSGSFNEPCGNGFKDDGGGWGFETLEDDDFREDKVVSTEVAADLEYVEEEVGFGFKVYPRAEVYEVCWFKADKAVAVVGVTVGGRWFTWELELRVAEE
jgi:hypothetical protein